MAEGVVVKSKINKATKVALGLALILIFMMILIIFAQNGSENGTGGLLNTALGVLIVFSTIWFFAKRKNRNIQKTQYDIIKHIADSEYKDSSNTLNVRHVNVERGGACETYVHFIENHVTYLYYEGVGVVETHKGRDIGAVKRGKQKDEIAMAAAKMGLTNQANRDKLAAAGLYVEPTEE